MKNTFLIIFTMFMVCITTSVSFGQVVLQRCDVDYLWSTGSSNSISLDVNEKKEGAGSISMTGSSTGWFKKIFSQTDVGVDETGWFSFWLYVSDVSKFNGEGQVEISSGGAYDIDEYSWPVSSLGLTNGWNYVNVPIASATKLGSPSLKAINFFRIYQPLSDIITAKLDFLKFSNDETPVVSTDPLYVPEVDFTTLDGKVMFGYQGWFSHPDDGSELARWRHWGTMQDEKTLSVEMFPDMREYGPDEQFETGLTFADGSRARVYSAYNSNTVERHMKWLRDYSLDGVFLQRFNVSLNDPKLKAVRDTVTVNIMRGSEKYGRTFVNMWDLSGKGAGCSADLIADWKHLVDNLKITESPNYLHHRGKPLVAIWGFTVRSELPEADLQAMIDFFKNSPEEKYRATIMLGVNHDFFNRSAWQNELKQVDVISPWAVGRYNSTGSHQNFINNYVNPGQTWCDQNNIDFLPVIWPGFSWYNLKNESTSEQNKIPRNGGNFFWTQANRVMKSNAKMIYIAMFDEVDEATSMFKTAEVPSMSPAQGYWLNLNADGYNLPSDWYLRSAKLTTQALKGKTENRSFLNTPPDGLDIYEVQVKHERCDAGNGSLVLRYPHTDTNPLLEYSIDGGINYDYQTPTSSESFSIPDLKAGNYEIWMKVAGETTTLNLGKYVMVNSAPAMEVSTTSSTCLNDGILHFRVDNNPYGGAVEISIDNGQNYQYAIADGVFEGQIENLSPGSYSVWAKWTDIGCQVKIGDYVIASNTPTPVANFKVYESIETGPVCNGSDVMVVAGTSVSVSSWSWTGPNGFTANTASALISDSITTEHEGDYTVEYTSSNGCKKSKVISLSLSGKYVPPADYMVEANGKLFDPAQVQFCEGDVMILEGLPNESGLSWSWSGPNNFRAAVRRKTLTASASSNNSGIYSLMVTNSDGCVKKVVKEIVVNTAGSCVLAVNENSLSNQVNIYPNPTNELVTIDLPTAGTYHIDILDVNGRVLLERKDIHKTNFQIDISSWNTGIYILKIIDDAGNTYSNKIYKY